MTRAIVHFPTSARPPGRFRLDDVNWVGVGALYAKEVRRFLKQPIYTVLAPMTTGLLFLTVFVVALGDVARGIGPVPLAVFLVPGLAMMTLIQTSFENPAGSLLSSKLLGSIIDLMMAPLSPGEILFGYVMAGVTRGLLVATVMLVLVQPLVGVVPIHPGYVIFHAVAAAVSLAALGFAVGLWAAKWDHLEAVAQFTITPLAILSGTFYSVDRLPGVWHRLSEFNPFFYMIDGFRYGFIGHADGSLGAGLAVMTVLPVALLALAYGLIRAGYKVRS